jgi:hypothetical protein
VVGAAQANMKNFILVLMLSTAALAQTKKIEMVNYSPLKVKLRAGYWQEKEQLKGCVIYLQGLADSMMNHENYFSSLAEAGYRVMAFDYMGQGGSQGSMDNTRIQIRLPINATHLMINKYERRDKYNEIQEQAHFIWNHFKNVKNDLGQSCQS